MRTAKNRVLRLGITFILMSFLALALAIMGSAMAGTARADTCTVSSGNSCDATSNVSANLSGSLSTTANNITASANLTGASQAVSFSLLNNLSDSRGGSVQWQLNAKSSGLTINTSSGSTNVPLVLTSVTAACSSASSCTNATITDMTGGSLSLTATSADFARAPTGGDFGTTNVTAAGSFTIPASTIGGSYATTIVVSVFTALQP